MQEQDAGTAAMRKLVAWGHTKPEGRMTARGGHRDIARDHWHEEGYSVYTGGV